jgi:hypothetical protein
MPPVSSSRSRASATARRQKSRSRRVTGGKAPPASSVTIGRLDRPGITFAFLLMPAETRHRAKGLQRGLPSA